MNDTSKQTYISACCAFTPDERDNTEAIPYYRAAAGIKAVWGELFCETYGDAYHRCFCMAGAVPVEQGLDVARKTLEAYANDMRIPERPRTINSWRCMPSEPDDNAVKAYFDREYKRVFPANRRGSKHYREMWESRKNKAREICIDAYRAELAAYQSAEDKLDAENAENLAKWQDKLIGINQFRTEVARILDVKVGD